MSQWTYFLSPYRAICHLVNLVLLCADRIAWLVRTCQPRAPLTLQPHTDSACQQPSFPYTPRPLSTDQKHDYCGYRRYLVSRGVQSRRPWQVTNAGSVPRQMSFPTCTTSYIKIHVLLQFRGISFLPAKRRWHNSSCVPHQRQIDIRKGKSEYQLQILSSSLLPATFKTPLEIHLCPLPAISTQHLHPPFLISSLHLLSTFSGCPLISRIFVFIVVYRLFCSSLQNKTFSCRAALYN